MHTPAPTPQFAALGGLTVHYADSGSHDAPPLVFANSLGTDLRIWDRVLALLQGRFRTIRYDLRGHGLSDAPPGPYDLPTLVDDLAGLLDFLQVRGATVCGLSVGGLIAQGLYHSRPDLVAALMLCDTGARIGDDAMWDQRMAAIAAGDIDALAEPILERWFSASLLASQPVEVQGWRNMLVRTPRTGYLGTCAALRSSDLTAATRDIKVPTLCLCGDQDGATPPQLVRALADMIPGAKFELIDQAGHLPCIEQPAAFAAHVLRFTKQQNPGRTARS